LNHNPLGGTHTE